jgi:hypothetical protein
MLAQAAPSPWTTEKGVRYLELAPVGAGKPGFTRLGADLTGITFTNRLSEATVAINRIMENGSGVALGDVDGDGLCDIYLTGMESGNRLYRNLGGWKFADITDRAGVACDGQFSTGAVLADVDGDGDLDLLVNGIGKGTRLFLNQGGGAFRERKDSGLLPRGGSHSLALADADGDGDLDLYVTNYRTTTWQDRPAGETRDVRIINGKPVVRPADRWLAIMTHTGGVTLIELGEVDPYYRNDGTGRFTLVDWTDGTFLDADGRPLTEPPRDWGLSVLFRDLTGDGFPDLYVCNDFYYSRDRVWINDGHGRFRAIAPMRLRSLCETAMALDVADINRDGWDDLLVMDMLPRGHATRLTRWDNLWKQVVPAPLEDPAFSPEYPRNMLFLNRGDGTWAEIARLAGLDATGWSWSVVFLDVDLDGYEDVLITTGHARDMLHADVLRGTGPAPAGRETENRLRFYQKYQPMLLPKLAFRNQGDLTFAEMGKAWGFDDTGVAHGIALGDLDNDGDLDVVVNQYRGPAAVYRNDSPAPRLALRLRGQPPNTHGIGARMRVRGGPVPQSTEIVSGGRYLSGDGATRCFAAGSVDAGLQIEVAWRSGKVSRISGARANRLYEIQEPAADGKETAPAPSPCPPNPISPISPISPIGPTPAPPLFEDVTEWLHGHTNADALFDDYERQPLLPRKLSHPGPALAWFDLDRDGWDDLVVGGGRGGAFTVFANKEGRQFAAIPGGTLMADQAAVLGWLQNPQRPLLLAANSHYEDFEKKTNTPAVRYYDPAGFQVGTVIADFPHALGPMALGDFDADGDLDLFVGGRVIPGRYPEAAASRLYRNDLGKFVVDEAASTLFERLGLVNGATFSDLNGDGYPDLVVACEWGPIRVFANLRGRFVERTKELGLGEHTGWWQGVATGDFDGDGQLDIIASNWGRNGESHPQPGHPLTLWAGDLGGNGSVDILEADWEDELGGWVPRRNLETIALAAPWVKGEFATCEAFAHASLTNIFRERLTNATRFAVTTLDSSVFIAKRGRFERRSLPVEAQFSPAFGLAVGDFDGDGREDVFLAQNFFPVAADRSRQDAGLGLVLLGDGQGGFRPLSALESGVRILGEQRACAVADFDADGRLDLAVGQNRGVTRLFHNRQARPALRVRLRGPGGNLDVVGTQLAAMVSETPPLPHGRGLVREVRSGSGYWSQDSVVVLVPSPSPVRQLWVRWPRGKEMTVAVPESAKEIRLTGLGEVTVLR